MSYQSGQTTITGNVTVSSTSQIATLGSTQTWVQGSFSTTGSNQTVYTVTSGKTFYLYGISMSTDGGAGNLYVYKSDGTTLLMRINPGTSGPISNPLVAGVPLAVYTTGTNVVFKGDNSHTGGYWGVEQ